MSAKAYPLMLPTPTGHWTAVPAGALREEFKYAADAVTIDAPEWMPAGGCHNWVGNSDTVYMQPHGSIRGEE